MRACGHPGASGVVARPPDLQHCPASTTSRTVAADPRRRRPGDPRCSGRIAARRSAIPSARARQLTPEASAKGGLLHVRSPARAIPQDGRRHGRRVLRAGRARGAGAGGVRGPDAAAGIEGPRRAGAPVLAHPPRHQDAGGRGLRPRHPAAAQALRAKAALACGRQAQPPRRAGHAQAHGPPRRRVAAARRRAGRGRPRVLRRQARRHAAGRGGAAGSGGCRGGTGRHRRGGGRGHPGGARRRLAHRELGRDPPGRRPRTRDDLLHAAKTSWPWCECPSRPAPKRAPASP